MTTPPPEPEITDEHIALLTDLHAVIAQAMTDTPYVLGQPIDDYAAVITVDVAAYMGKQVAGVPTELDRLRELVGDLADPDPCDHFDHHGNCQTHGWFDGRHSAETCPHGRAQRAGLVHNDEEES